MNIDELQAGRELDALVAKRVMGWSTVCFDGIGQVWTGVPPDENGRQRVISYYSENIAAAWQVVERVKPNPDLFAEFMNNLHKLCGTHDYFPDVAASVMMKNISPLIICQAALGAIEK